MKAQMKSTAALNKRCVRPLNSLVLYQQSGARSAGLVR